MRNPRITIIAIIAAAMIITAVAAVGQTPEASPRRTCPRSGSSGSSGACPGRR